MEPPAQPHCLACAWRENCTKRWRVSHAEMLRCLDYSFDVRLATQGAGDAGAPPEGHGEGGGEEEG